MVCIDGSIIFKEILNRNILALLKHYMLLESEQTLDNVIGCIGNTVAESVRFRDAALKLGILDRVVDLSKDMTRSLGLTRSCMFLISNLFRGKPSPDKEKVKIF